MRVNRLVLVTLGVLLSFGPAAAVTITFQTTDLADATAGEDLWSYTYFVDDFGHGVDVAFETLFAVDRYQALQDPPPAVNADWSLLTLQPDPGIPDPGRYSALALVSEPSLVDPFTLTFVWLGGAGTQPGSQPFEIVQFDALGNFVATLEVGQTRPAGPTQSVPGPGTLTLLLTGILGVAALTRARVGVAAGPR
jgi:hypothetical protein